MGKRQGKLAACIVAFGPSSHIPRCEEGLFSCPGARRNSQHAREGQCEGRVWCLTPAKIGLLPRVATGGPAAKVVLKLAESESAGVCGHTVAATGSFVVSGSFSRVSSARHKRKAPCMSNTQAKPISGPAEKTAGAATITVPRSAVASGAVGGLTGGVAFGLVFALATVRLARRWPVMAAAGLGYGLLLWVTGPLLLMPAVLGMPIWQFTTMAYQSLLGHLVFGVVLAVVVAAWANRARA